MSSFEEQIPSNLICISKYWRIHLRKSVFIIENVTQRYATEHNFSSVWQAEKKKVEEQEKKACVSFLFKEKRQEQGRLIFKDECLKQLH